MAQSVITIYDRFTISTEQGQGNMYSRWIRVPEWCRYAEFRAECHSFNSGDVDFTIESSMDQTSKIDLWAGALTSVEVEQGAVTSGIGRYIRMRLSGKTTSAKPNMVISAFAIFRSAA